MASKARFRSDTPPDAVGLDLPAKERAAGKISRLAGPKILVALFFIFVFVVSDVFTSNVVAGFRGAVPAGQRTPTSYGIAVQGVFLVLFYVLFLHLSEGGVV